MKYDKIIALANDVIEPKETYFVVLTTKYRINNGSNNNKPKCKKFVTVIAPTYPKDVATALPPLNLANTG